MNVFFLCLLAVLVGTGAFMPAWAREPVPELNPQQVAPNIYFFQGKAGVASQENRGFNSNAGFVVTNEGVVVIDALGTPSLGQAMIDAIGKITNKPVKRVIVTHYHADHFYGTVPVVRELTPEEVAEDYETNTGVVIVQCFRERGISPLEMPACFQKFHAPFTWGKSALDSVKNSVALEVCCEIAMGTWQLNPGQGALPAHILDKHYLRKHGPGAYYGQS